MRWWLWLVVPALLACDLQVPGWDASRLHGELSETVAAAFVMGREATDYPGGPLVFRAGGVYSGDPEPGPSGAWVWQVRHPRADIVTLPLTARDRFEGVELSADVVVRFEQRYCALAPDSGLTAACSPWQAATCCNQLWKRARGAWAAGPP